MMLRRLVFRNSFWLMGDKLVRLGLGLVVWLWLARAQGPEAFGTWNFAIAFAALFASVATLGLDGVVQRELLQRRGAEPTILGTALAMRVIAGCLMAILCVASARLLRDTTGTTLALIACNALLLPLQSAQVFEYHFQARMNTRPSVLAAIGAFLLLSAVRLWMLWQQASLQAFGVTLVAEAALYAMLLVSALRLDGFHWTQLRIDRALGKQLLAESWPLLLSGIAVMIYMRIDQVMLSSMIGDRAVGQFSAALRISEVWYFIPLALVTAAFPAMLEKRSSQPGDYERHVQKLYDVMAWIGIGVAIAFTFGADMLIRLLYGPQYSEAATVLRVQTWAGVAVSMSFVHGKWLIGEGLQRLGLVYTLAGCTVNLALNFVLIPRYGAVGAAWATLCTQVGLLPLQLLFPRARRNFVLMIRALAAPVRILGQ